MKKLELKAKVRHYLLSIKSLFVLAVSISAGGYGYYANNMNGFFFSGVFGFLFLIAVLLYYNRKINTKNYLLQVQDEPVLKVFLHKNTYLIPFDDLLIDEVRMDKQYVIYKQKKAVFQMTHKEWGIDAITKFRRYFKGRIIGKGTSISQEILEPIDKVGTVAENTLGCLSILGL